MVNWRNIKKRKKNLRIRSVLCTAVKSNAKIQVSRTMTPTERPELMVKKRKKG